jgi:hypothetical protein
MPVALVTGNDIMVSSSFVEEVEWRDLMGQVKASLEQLLALVVEQF